MTPTDLKFIIGFFLCPAYVCVGTWWLVKWNWPKPKPKHRKRIKNKLIKAT